MSKRRAEDFAAPGKRWVRRNVFHALPVEIDGAPVIEPLQKFRARTQITRCGGRNGFRKLSDGHQALLRAPRTSGTSTR